MIWSYNPIGFACIYFGNGISPYPWVFINWLIKLLGMQNSWYLQFILTTLVLVIPGRRFYLKGLPALLRLAPDMNSLVAVGTLAAYLFSIVATFIPNILPTGTVNVYYEAAAVIVALILLGRFLEAKAKGRTSWSNPAFSQLTGQNCPCFSLRPNGRYCTRPSGCRWHYHCETRWKNPVDGQVTDGKVLLMNPWLRVNQSLLRKASAVMW